MTKPFYEVFSTLKIQDDLADILHHVNIDRITVSDEMRRMDVYLTCDRLIQRDEIRMLQKQIKEQIFHKKNMDVILHENFRLSQQYTAENLYDAYKDSIYGDFRSYNMIQYMMLKTGHISFDGNHMTIEIEKNSLHTRAADDLIIKLESSIFKKRCGVDVSVEIVFRERVDDRQDIVADALQEISEVDAIYNEGEATATKDINDDIEYFVYDADGINLSGEMIIAPKASGAEDKQPTESKTTKSNTKYKNAAETSYRRKKQPTSQEDPSIIVGYGFDDEPLRMMDIVGELPEIVVAGMVTEVDESRYFDKTESTLFTFAITDFTDTIAVKIFAKPDDTARLKDELKAGAFLKVKGRSSYDTFERDICITARSIKKCEPFAMDERKDTATIKRVELHCHTKMSDLDGVSSISDILEKAKSFGMDAIAITDHGNVQAFIEGYHALEKMKDAPKIIYGLEGYMVDDMEDIVINPSGATLADDFVVFDIETTGFSSKKNRIIEIGAVKIQAGRIVDRFSTFVNPAVPIPFRIEQLTGIGDDMVKAAPTIEEVLPRFLDFCEGCVIVAHNATFDTGFIRANATRLSLAYAPSIVDTVAIARILLPKLNNAKLNVVAKELGITLENHHRAVDDAECTAQIFLKFIEMLEAQGVHTLEELQALGKSSTSIVAKKLPTYHVIILVKNETGRRNLYEIVSHSHIDYFHKKPRIPRSMLSELREGLIIGSACSDGELFRNIMREENDDGLSKIASFYDYLEIQPVANNQYLIHSEKIDSIKSEDDIRAINKRIVELGEELDKPVVATGDVHFLNPEDEIYRRIIMYGNKFSGADEQPPLFLHTTDEMLEEFSYLGQQKAREVVIDNTRYINSMTDHIKPVRPDKCPPVIEDSDITLREACYKKAYEQYGDPLPDIVKKRLEKELGSIISNGFAVMYIIAKELVEKSMSDGYLVGSRGSVGSSFAAYTSGITEVNPLSPHYYCEKCKYSEFDSDEVKKYAGMAGCDMPDKTCPNCGATLKKDGFDIPFETFLGFKGDKEPDIDLNFSGEYQSKAHDYTEVLFGEGNTFRAGTIGTVADKTAFGYVKNYFEAHGKEKRKREINRILQGCMGIKQTTGQHPGGIVIKPKGEDIYTFTPVQYPANKVEKNTITTHFDYHAIDHNLLKLDILGHDDPSMIRMLQDLTGIDPVRDIPLDCAEVMSLFQNTQALGITPDDIGGCKLGALGIPEFGTSFAMAMVMDAKPKYFSDLVRISGLSHGTDVWQGNAEKLIKEGTATIRTAICTRDDIMLYLIQMGMDESESFNIMEAVRKGKGLKPEWEEHMKAVGVPDWYIWSCNMIKYMFPRAHAVAYVMMAWRIAYCKIYYPLAYYASYFSIRAKAFSYELMCFGKSKLEAHMASINKEAEKNDGFMQKKDKDTLRDMRIVQEMYARGYEFTPIDLYRARADRFQIVDGKIMPSFTSIPGIGDVAARQIEEAGAGGKYTSKEDFRRRSKSGQATSDLLSRVGVLDGLPDDDQISIFDIG